MLRYFFLPSAIILLCAFAGAFYFVPSNIGDSMMLPQLLELAIGISGVTIPVAISYGLSSRTDIRVSVAEAIEGALADRGISRELFMDAFLDRAYSNPDKGRPSRKGILEILGEAYIQREIYDHQTRRHPPFPDDVKRWLFANSSRWLKFVYDDQVDRRISASYLIGLVFLLIACLFQLYAHYLGIYGAFTGALVERAIFLATLGFNFASYATLSWFSIRQQSITSQINLGMARLIPQIEGDIDDYRRRVSKMR